MVGGRDHGIILLLILVVRERAADGELQRYTPGVLEPFSSNLLFFAFRVVASFFDLFE